jgi:hypothetical protein
LSQVWSARDEVWILLVALVVLGAATVSTLRRGPVPSGLGEDRVTSVGVASATGPS